MTPGARSVLEYLVKHEHTDKGEIVCERLECWMGYRRVHRKTVNALIDCMAITNSAINGESVQRWVVTETGKQHLKYPGLEEKLFVALRTKGKGGFRIVDGEIVYFDDTPTSRPRRPRSPRRPRARSRQP